MAPQDPSNPPGHGYPPPPPPHGQGPQGYGSGGYAPAGPNPFRRAAIFCWVLGGLEIVGFGFCAFSFFIVASGAVSLTEVMSAQANSGQMTDEQADAIMQWEAMAPSVKYAFALTPVVFGMLPGLLYVLLGKGVREGRTTPLMTCLVLAVSQVVVMGLFTALAALGAMASGNPASIVVVVLFYGTPLALVLFTARWLFAARKAQVRGLLHMYHNINRATAAQIGQTHAHVMNAQSPPASQAPADASPPPGPALPSDSSTSSNADASSPGNHTPPGPAPPPASPPPAPPGAEPWDRPSTPDR